MSSVPEVTSVPERLARATENPSLCEPGIGGIAPCPAAQKPSLEPQQPSSVPWSWLVCFVPSQGQVWICSVEGASLGGGRSQLTRPTSLLASELAVMVVREPSRLRIQKSVPMTSGVPDAPPLCRRRCPCTAPMAREGFEMPTPGAPLAALPPPACLAQRPSAERPSVLVLNEARCPGTRVLSCLPAATTEFKSSLSRVLVLWLRQAQEASVFNLSLNWGL